LVATNVQADHVVFPNNYDDSSETYDDQSDVYTEQLNIDGGCLSSLKQSALVTAELASDAVAGKEIVVKATVKNTGETTTVYTMTASNYDSWADFEKIDPTILTLEAGQTGTTSIYLMPFSDSTGEKTFTIKAFFAGKSTEQTVSVTLEKASGIRGISGAAIEESIRQNGLVWLIVLVNVILIIAIIVVAVKISSKRRVEEE